MSFQKLPKLLIKNKIDGFFCGAAEESINAAISLSELSGVPFIQIENNGMSCR